MSTETRMRRTTDVCTVMACKEPVRVPRHGLCRRHYGYAREHGLVEIQQLTKSTSYDAAIQRVRVRRGSAKQQQCIECRGPAQCWGYIKGTSPNELTEPHPRTGALLAYSTDPKDWQPYCRSCRNYAIAEGKK